jgi:hypothetical protein
LLATETVGSVDACAAQANAGPATAMIAATNTPRSVW